MVVLTLDFPHTEPPESRAAKETLLQRQHASLSTTLTQGSDGVTLPPEWVAVCRIILSTDDEMYLYLYDALPRDHRISAWNELKVVKHLNTLLATCDTTRPESADLVHSATAYVQRHLAEPLSPLFRPPTVAPDSDDIRRFVQWYEARCGPVPVEIVDLADTSKGRSLITRQAVVAGDAILSVPEAEMINIFTVHASPEWPILQTLQLSDDDALLLYIMKDRYDPRSPRADYWRVVPEECTSPLVWTLPELMELDGCDVLEETIALKQSMQERYAALFPYLLQTYPDVFPSEVYTWPRYITCRCLLDSRCFKLRVRGEDVNCLIPYADMLNHSTQGNVSYRVFDELTNTVRLLALRDLPPGVEVRMHYSPLTDSETLLYYGFVDPENPDAGIHIALEPEEGYPGRRLLEEFGVPTKHWIPTTGFLAGPLLAAVRCFAADDTDIAHATASGWDPRCNVPLSAENETRARDVLRQLLVSTLEAFPTSLIDDEEALPAATGNRRLALLFRVAQKGILRRAIATL